MSPNDYKWDAPMIDYSYSISYDTHIGEQTKSITKEELYNRKKLHRIKELRGRSKYEASKILFRSLRPGTVIEEENGNFYRIFRYYLKSFDFRIAKAIEVLVADLGCLDFTIRGNMILAFNTKNFDIHVGCDSNLLSEHPLLYF